MIGAYLACDALMLLLGLSGWVKRFIDAIPMPIVMGMVAGVFLRFGLDLVFAIRDAFWTAAPMTAVFLGLSASPRLARLLPPVIAALIVGAIMIAVPGGFDASGAEVLVIVRPHL